MTSPIAPASQYASAKPFFDRAPSNSSNLTGSPEDIDRLKAYALYEDFYYNRPETFRVFIRGEDEDQQEIYIPSAKKMVEAMNRFLAKEYNYVVSPSSGDEASQNEIVLRLGNLAKREKLIAKFSNQKRMGLVRGDACFYVTADPSKPQHSRISVNELNPGNYFPIKDPNSKSRILGCHIVEVIHDPREKDDKTKTIAKRQTYLKAGVNFNATSGQYEEVPGAGALQGIFYSVTHWELGKWDDRNMKADDLKQVTGGTIPDVPTMQLAAPINTLPIYHWKNTRIGEDTLFGLSELAGIESLIAAINQSMSDEDLTLVLQGLGIYVTDSKPPVNADGTQADWEIGPGRVAEVAEGRKFDRVTGVSSVAPFLDHVNALKEGMQEGNGIPDIAAGKVDVTVAESGISLALQLAPIIASAQEKEQEILSTMDHLLYDIVYQWFPAYEQILVEDIVVSSAVGDAMPVNREARIQEILLLFTSNLITIAMAQAELAKFGYNFAAGDDKQVLREAAALAQAQMGDLDANRYQQEEEAKERGLTPGAGEMPEQFSVMGNATAVSVPGGPQAPTLPKVGV